MSAPVEAVKNAASAAVETVKEAVTTPIDTSAPERRGSTDDSSVVSPTNTAARVKLERQLSHRPDVNELVEKNILKNPHVAPSLQAAQADLARAQLEDKLENKLQARPSPEELVKEGILQKDEIPGA
ncbi:hypothetical protein FRB99_006366 [Tulasnella sp. 403]|nr:hypothetical protein FRB99_006366 [Tulasnella sp. 403]